MHPGALKALEFDRIVSVLAGFAVTPTGEARLSALLPMTEPGRVVAALRATTEGVRFLATTPGFPLRAPAELDVILDGLAVEGRPLEPLRLIGLADYLESIELTRGAIRAAEGDFPILRTLVGTVASFKPEIAQVRRKIDPSGDVADNASPALSGLRDRLRKHRARLRSTLDSILRERSKYLQEQVITDRNGRYVLVVRAEHRSAIPGIVHGASASGASLYLEPLNTVEINNDIVALQEEEAAEVRRILVEITDAFRRRPEELRDTFDVAAEIDVIQAKARFAALVDGVEPAISTDGTFELRAARHPLLIWGRESFNEDTSREGPRVREVSSLNDSRPLSPVPVDILMIPPVRVLLITGPNTGGKTVALKTAGLLAVMAQAGLHIPAVHGSRLPIFKSLFADIGDEQSISASLSTFSGHVSNVVSMDRDLHLPALVLLDEVGAGTDPIEGGALGTAVIDHFRRRGAHLVATTHFDSLKSYASTTEGVTGAAFGFNPETYAPTYRLLYGSPGRSLALEIAQRLGMPPSVIAAARGQVGDRERQLSDHIAKIDEDLRALERERHALNTERAQLKETERQLRARDDAVRQREETFRRRLDTKLDERLRDARREIDVVIDDLRTRAAELTQQASRDAARPISTGETGRARADARAAVDAVMARVRDEADGAGGVDGTGRVIEDERSSPRASLAPPAPLAPGSRVAVGTLGLEGTVIHVHDGHAEVDVNGKRLRAALRDLRVIGGPRIAASVRLQVDLQPRDEATGELNVIGCTVDDAVGRTERFIDENMVTDRRTLRIIHGHGKGQLRRAIADLLKQHPLVTRFETAQPDQGGGGVTVVELKE